MNSNALVVFVKNLVLGTYKTRIAKVEGSEYAENIYRHLLQKTAQLTTEFRGTCYLYYNQYVPATEEEDYFPANANRRKQQGRDLGERMKNAFEATLKSHSKCILIGSDCPLLTGQHLNRAIKLLDQNELVLGPAEDGGYYLIAMKNYHPGLFRNIEWSSETVLKKTLAAARYHHLTFSLLDQLYDIDYAEDWKRYLGGQKGDQLPHSFTS